MVYVPELTSEVDNTNFIEHDIIHSISYEMKGITCDRSFVRCMILHSLMVVANRNVLSWHKKQNESIWNEYEKRKEHMKRDLFRSKVLQIRVPLTFFQTYTTRTLPVHNVCFVAKMYEVAHPVPSKCLAIHLPPSPHYLSPHPRK